MNKTFFKIILPLWLLIVIANFLIPKKAFSETENRFLTEFPSFSAEKLFNGEFMQNVDNYFNDHFALRDQWITLKTGLDLSVGKRESNGVYIGKDVLLENIQTPNQTYVDKNIQGIKSFADKYKSNIYFMLVPSASAIQPEKLPPLAPTWDQQEYIINTYAKLPNGVTAIDAYTALKAHSDEYIYYRTDHHWTTKGAFYAYQEASKTMNLAKREQNDFVIKKQTDDFYGTLASKSGMRVMKADSIETYDLSTKSTFSVTSDNKTKDYDSIYFKEFLGKKDKYSFFLGTNQPVVTIKTDSKSDKKLLLFKDSYSHCFAPFFVEDYSEIVLMDMRYINTDIDNVIQVSDYSDVLFMYSMDVFTHQNQLSKLIK